MTIKAILPAAGLAERWNRYLGVEKHLAAVSRTDTTPLIVRTLRLLAERGIEQRCVVTDHSEIASAAAPLAEVIHPAGSSCLSETLLSARRAWSDRTLVLLGDVYFSGAALEAIACDRHPLRFFGIDYNSPAHDRGRRPEIFAMAFDRSRHESVQRALEMNSQLAALRQAHRLHWKAVRHRRDLLRQLVLCNHSPRPPKWLRWFGMARRPIWRWYRALKGSRPRHAWMYGKLFGLYLTCGDVDPFAGDDYAQWQGSREYFHTIDDLTRDIDCPEDYRQLLEDIARQ